MRLFLTLFFCFLFSFECGWRSSSKEVLNISFSPKSLLVIRGKSNVNKFSCDYNSYNLSDSLSIFYEKVKDKLVFSDASLSLSVESFDCARRGINRDFKKLLKSKEFPFIKMTLKDVLLKKEKKDTLFTNISFTICNLTKEYKIPVAFRKKNEFLEFDGSIIINIEDFDLKAPNKVLGLIKVDNSIEINFNLIAQLKK